MKKLITVLAATLCASAIADSTQAAPIIPTSGHVGIFVGVGLALVATYVALVRSVRGRTHARLANKESRGDCLLPLTNASSLLKRSAAVRHRMSDDRPSGAGQFYGHDAATPRVMAGV